MSTNSFKVKNSLQIKPSASAGTEAGDLRVDSSDSNKLKFHNGTTEDSVATATDITDVSADIATAQAAADAAQSDIDAHELDTANPHSVTATQIGLGNVDNTSDADKPISDAAQAAIDLKAPLASPTFTGTIGTPLTASRALATDGSGNLAASSATATELGYLSGVTGPIQTQINSSLTNPMSTGGDLIYGGASGVPTRLANGTANQFLASAGGTSAPVWTTFAVPTFQKLTSTGSKSGSLFTITSGNATVGATYTNNGQTFTVLETIAAGTQLFTSGSGAPQASGTLTKSGGTGDATLTFSTSINLATYTLPSSPHAPVSLRVRMVGGGGGGAGSGNSGPGNGGAGGTTVFGTNLLIANGGAATTSVVIPGAGGTTTINSPAIGFSFTGEDGTAGGFSGTSGAVQLPGGKGASSAFGGGGKNGAGANSSGTAGGAAQTNTGSGGGGAGAGTTASTSTGAGGSAGGYVEAVISSPASTYYYAVGTAGSNGTAGTNGQAGGAGAAGIIIVEERYQ